MGVVRGPGSVVLVRRRDVQLWCDDEADAAYVHLVEAIRPGEVARTVTVTAPGIDDDVNIDLDAEGRILGIEILGASRRLRDG